MSAVRQELLEQIAKLDDNQQQELLDYVRVLAKPHQPSWSEWLTLADQAQDELRTKYGDQHYFDSQTILDEVRK